MVVRVCVCVRERERGGKEQGQGAGHHVRAFALSSLASTSSPPHKSYLVRRTAPRPLRPGRPSTRPGGTRAVGTGRRAGWGRGRGVGLGWMGAGRGRGARGGGWGEGGERHSSSTQQAEGDGARPRPAPHDATGVPSALGSARAGCVGPGRGPPPCPLCPRPPKRQPGYFLARREARKGPRTSFAARPRQGTRARGPPRHPPRQARLGVQRASGHAGCVCTVPPPCGRGRREPEAAIPPPARHWRSLSFPLLSLPTPPPPPPTAPHPPPGRGGEATPLLVPPSPRRRPPRRMAENREATGERAERDGSMRAAREGGGGGLAGEAGSASSGGDVEGGSMERGSDGVCGRGQATRARGGRVGKRNNWGRASAARACFFLRLLGPTRRSPCVFLAAQH